MTTNYARGTALERYVAKRLGGVRVGLAGKATADVEVGQLSIECKERKDLPGWLVDAVEQAKSNAKHGELIPVVVLHCAGSRHDDDLVIMRLGEFADADAA